MKRIIAVWLLLAALCLSLFSCTTPEGGEGTRATGTTSATPTGDPIDYAAAVTLDMNSPLTVKQEVTVKYYIDGDTTHFNVPKSIVDTGILKARYLAINTPESTGKIEEYGKQASMFTKEKLQSATSIVIESDDTNWNVDSTGGRYLVWVWYKTAGSDTYRNLNIEILQRGLAIASNSAQNRYGTTCMAAINQAKAFKLKIYCGVKNADPYFYYGAAQLVTLKELRTHIEEYTGVDVAFEAVVTTDSGDNGVYVEEYDEETDTYYGMYVYYGFSAHGDVLEMLTPGNRVRIVGSCQLYETAGTYQVSGLKYSPMRPNDPSYISKIGEGYSAAYRALDVERYLGRDNVTLSFETDEGIEERTYDYAELLLNTSVSLEHLTVTKISTTHNGGNNDGAMTLTCKTQDGKTVKIRTTVFRDGEGDLITSDAYLNKVISIRGFVEYYKPEQSSGDGFFYQIKVLSPSAVTVEAE